MDFKTATLKNLLMMLTEEQIKSKIPEGFKVFQNSGFLYGVPFHVVKISDYTNNFRGVSYESLQKNSTKECFADILACMMVDNIIHA